MYIDIKECVPFERFFEYIFTSVTKFKSNLKSFLLFKHLNLFCNTCDAAVHFYRHFHKIITLSPFNIKGQLPKVLVQYNINFD